MLFVPQEFGCTMNKRFRWLLGGDYSFLLIAIAITFSTTMSSKAAKHLVLIAGPRQEGIQEFFYQLATGLETSSKRSESLRGWRWPILREEDLDLLLREKVEETNVSRHNDFDLLFRRKNDSVIQEVLMEAIRYSWEKSTHGIMLGEERFGKVGVNPFTSDDALKVIYRLMENLSIRTKDVTLVLIYDTPRIEQWASVWREQSTYEKYNDFLCKSNEADERFEYIDTAMNPFKLAKVYRQHGWNVVVLDEDGVRRSGFDPAHAIACNILGVSCEEGWITGLKEEISRPLPSYEINELDEDNKHELEQLFLLRDCCYKEDLELRSGTKEFQIVNQDSIWRDCRNKYDFELREKIRDVHFFLNVIQSQKGCEREFVDLSDILSSTNVSSFEKLLWPIIFSSILFLAIVSGVLFIREKHGKNIRNEFDGLFRDSNFWRRKSTNPMPPDTADRSKSSCNACKFVRFDPNCIFCHDGKRLTSSEIGKEVERRMKQYQTRNLVGVTDEAEGENEVGPQVSSAPASHLQEAFDMNLRNTRSESKKRRKKEQREKSKAVRKFNELLVLKTESEDKVYTLTEPSDFSSGDNLQTIFFDEDDDIYV